MFLSISDTTIICHIYYQFLFSVLPGNGSQFDVPSKMMTHPLNISNPLNGIEAKSLSTVRDRDDMMFDSNARTVPSILACFRQLL